MKRYLFYLVLLLSRCTPAMAQNLYVKVGATYGVSAADDNKRVGEFYATGKDTISTGLYYAWQRWRAEGMPYATFRTRYLGCAIAKDIAWRYEAPSNIKSGYQNTFAFADWTDASGHWYANATMQIPRGGMKGQGSFGFYDDSQTSQVFATCEFELTEDWWPANATERRLFEGPNSGLNTPDNGSYNESFLITGFRLTGPAVYGDGIKRIGMFLRRSGECSEIDQINAAMLQYGIIINGAVPLKMGTITVFWNETCGVGFIGTWGATVKSDIISGDSNGELVGVHPGYGDEAGGSLNLSLLKDEDGILGESAQAPYRGTIALYIEGQYAVTVGNINCSRNYINTDALVVVNPVLTNGSPQSSHLVVENVKGFRYGTSLLNLQAHTRYASPGDYSAYGFEHYAQGDRMLGGAGLVATGCNCPPLGVLRTGSYDYTACTPKRAGAVTPPTTCTWIVGPETCGPCTSGVQSCTAAYVSSVTGCTPTGTKPNDQLAVKACNVPSTLTATAFSEGTDNSQPHPASAAIDGNASTYWHSGTGMQIGQTFTITLPAAKSVKGITFKIDPNHPNDYPTQYMVSTSATLTAAPAERARAGGGATSIATWPAVSTRVILITCQFTRGSWWSISEVTIQ